jgi:sugar phosphate isomerase/epimerase
MPRPALRHTLRHAMCNEPFGETPFAEACRAMHEAGYTGIEIAPFTLGAAPDQTTPERRRELRSIMAEEGLEFVGLHWLLAGPPGLHVTTPDEAVRRRSWNYVRDLIDLCADLSTSPAVMVFGSPKQRAATCGSTREEATRRFADGFRQLAPHAEARGVTLLVEALPAGQCDVVQTLAEAVAIVREIASPAVRTMFDTHNAVDETEPHAVLIERYFPLIRHVHVNEMDGRFPGTGDYDFATLLKTLERLSYTGWVSLEAMDFKPDPVTIARESLRYLKALQ